MNAIDKIVRYFLMILVWGAGFIAGGIPHVLGYNMAVVLGGILLVGAAILSHKLTWRPKSNVDKLARYGFLVTLWFVTFLFTMFVSSAPIAIFLEGYLSSSSFSLVWLVALTTVIMTSFSLFPRYDQNQSVTPSIDTAKRKNDHYPPVDPLDLLTDDDLEELRQEIKDEIRARLRYGSDDAVSSLEELIDDHQPPARAKRK